MICRGRRSTLVVDNTTATPLGQQPLSLGVDLVVASATKALAGHGDLVAGYVAGSNPDLMAAVAAERLLAGPILGAFEAWLVLRSAASFWSPRPASVAYTAPSTGASVGEIRSAAGSPGCRWASKTPMTCWPTSIVRCPGTDRDSPRQATSPP
jgi:hypothetical protein